MAVSRWTLARISLLLYFIALVTPAFRTPSGLFFGIQCLVAGWVLWMFWLANPMLLAAAILRRLKRFRAATVCAALAVLDALAFAVWLFVVNHNRVSAQPAGDRSMMIHIGYLAWLGSAIALLVAIVRRPRPDGARI